MKALLLAVLVAGGAGGAASALAAAPNREETRQTWEDYRIRTRQDLDVIGDRLAALESKASSAKAEVRENLQAKAAALRAKKADADRLLERFPTAAEDARPELRAKLDRLLNELKKSLDEAEAVRTDRGGSRPRLAFRIGELG